MGNSKKYLLIFAFILLIIHDKGATGAKNTPYSCQAETVPLAKKLMNSQSERFQLFNILQLPHTKIFID